VRGLLPTPYFASGTVPETTKETGDRYRLLLRTHCEKFAHGRCISADLRNTQKLKGLRPSPSGAGRNYSFSEAGQDLFDRKAIATGFFFTCFGFLAKKKPLELPRC